MTTPKGVAREWFDDVVRQRDAALERARLAEERYALLADKAMCLKAHEMGAAIGTTGTQHDPMAALGTKTQMAIESIAQGDPELRKDQIGKALLLTSAMAHDDDLEGDALDSAVAATIRAGDG